jgi:HTH-type transcriptional regulator/antitoxin HigA
MEPRQAKLFEDTPMSPGDRVRELLSERGWTQEELAQITGRSRQQIIDILNDERGISAEMAVALAGAFDATPEYWMKMDASHRLSKIRDTVGEVQQRVKMFKFAPIKDMQRRGWIKTTKNIAELQQELERFFGVASLDESPAFTVATRKTARLDDLTSPQRAWCFRARQLAEALQVSAFDAKRLDELKRKLRTLAAYPAEASKVSDFNEKIRNSLRGRRAFARRED